MCFAVGHILFCPTYTIRCPNDTYWTSKLKVFFISFTFGFACGKSAGQSIHNDPYQSYVSRDTHTHTQADLKTLGSKTLHSLLYLQGLKAFAQSKRAELGQGEGYRLRERQLLARALIAPRPPALLCLR